MQGADDRLYYMGKWYDLDNHDEFDELCALMEKNMATLIKCVDATVAMVEARKELH